MFTVLSEQGPVTQQNHLRFLFRFKNLQLRTRHACELAVSINEHVHTMLACFVYKIMMVNIMKGGQFLFRQTNTCIFKKIFLIRVT